MSVLPPGFRFRPTDEELITHYLLRKAGDAAFITDAVVEVNLYSFEPWELPQHWPRGEDQEYYFFCRRDKKYPTGVRANRATAAGYWKSTGKDKEIRMGSSLVGVKKTLVFYTGRAPKGLRTHWIMHEFRLEGLYASSDTAKTEWVICRVFAKRGNAAPVHQAPLAPVEEGEEGAGAPASAAVHPGFIFDPASSYSYSDNGMPPPLFYGHQASLMMLLQSGGYYGGLAPESSGKREVMPSNSEDTGLTTDKNVEISSDFFSS